MTKDRYLRVPLHTRFNSFCWYDCTGGNRDEIKGCQDTDCPFYPFRFGGLEPSVEADIYKKIIKDIGLL